MPRLQDLALERLAAADHVAHALVGLARDAHRDQLAGAIEPRQIGGIAFVVLPVDPGPLRDQRGRDHVAGVSPFRERPMEHIARAARFIARVDLAVARDPGDPLLESGRSFGNRSSRIGVFADPGRTAILMESLCTSIPR